MNRDIQIKGLSLSKSRKISLLAKGIDQDSLGAKESHTGNSWKVPAGCEDVLSGKVTQVVQIASSLKWTWLILDSVISIPK